MNKIDKLLYGGFAVVALAVIVAMLVSVFSPPQPPQKQAEEVTAEQEITMVDPVEYGKILKRWQENFEAARMQREANEELAKMLQAEKDAEIAAQEELDKVEQEWWESRKDWVENFPFEPTHHPEIRYDPNVYDARGSAHWPEEKKDEDFWDMMQRVGNHGFLRNFYASYLPYTEEFEQMYNIVKEEFGEVDDAITLGWTFNTLKEYHQAAQRDPEEVYRENARVEIPNTPDPAIEEFTLGDEFYNLPEKAQQEYLSVLQKAYEANRLPFKHEVRDITWGERAEDLKEGIIGHLMDQKDYEQLMEESVARAIQERLLNEIPAEGFLEMGEKERLCYVSTYESELKPGDPLLIK